MQQEVKDADAAVFIVDALQDYVYHCPDLVKGSDIGFIISGQLEAYSEVAASDINYQQIFI